MKIKGKITISRITSNSPRGSWVRISLEDENSHIHFVELDIDFKQFGMAITGQGSQPCDMELRGLESLGKKYENKMEFVLFPRNATEMEQERAVNKHEVNGWMGRTLDLKNHHNYEASKSSDEIVCYRVSFHRYV